MCFVWQCQCVKVWKASLKSIKLINEPFPINSIKLRGNGVICIQHFVMKIKLGTVTVRVASKFYQNSATSSSHFAIKRQDSFKTYLKLEHIKGNVHTIRHFIFSMLHNQELLTCQTFQINSYGFSQERQKQTI